jgi:ribosomal protein L13E
MSELLTPDHSPPDIQSPATKPQRVLACVLCQQRKVRCDRKFPCANCTKAEVQCQSAALLARQRRRRFPEKELLERVREYEELLRRNHIRFEPLHSSPTARSDGANREERETAPQEMGDKGSEERGTEPVKSVSPKVTSKLSSMCCCCLQILLLQTTTSYNINQLTVQ